MLNKFAKLVNQRGKLILTNSGSLCLLVPAPIVRGAFTAIPDQGTSLPNNIGRVIVMTPSEVNTIGPKNIDERGQEFNYRLGPIKEETGSKGFSKIWYQEVKSTELNNMRKSYGLSDKPSGNKFKLIIAVRKTNVLRDNAVSKLEKEPKVDVNDVDGPAHVMRIRIFRFSKFGEDNPLININYEDLIKSALEPMPEGDMTQNTTQGGIFRTVLSLAQQFLQGHGIQAQNPQKADEIAASQRIGTQIASGLALDADTDAAYRMAMGLISVFTDPRPFAQEAQQLAKYIKPVLPFMAQFSPDILDTFLGSQTVLRYRIASLGNMLGGIPTETLDMLNGHIQNKYFGPNATAPNYGFSPGKIGQLVTEMSKQGYLPLMYMQQNPEQAMQLIDQNLDEFLAALGAVHNAHPETDMNDAINTIFLVNSQRRKGDKTPLGVLVAQAMYLEPTTDMLRGATGSAVGMMQPEARQEATQKLMSQAANSRFGSHMGAILRAANDGAVAPNSEAARIADNISKYGWVNLESTQISSNQIAEILKRSGMPSQAAYAYATGTHANLAAFIRSPGAITFAHSVAQPAELMRRYQQFAAHSDPVTARANMDNYLAQVGFPDGLNSVEQLWPGFQEGVQGKGIKALRTAPAFAISRAKAERSSRPGYAGGFGQSLTDAIKDWESSDDTMGRVYKAMQLERIPADHKPEQSFTDAVKDFQQVQSKAPVFGKTGAYKYSTLKRLTPRKCFFRSCGG